MKPGEQQERRNKPCPACNGSGQTSRFLGESRFMFTHEDCPDCCGTGVDIADEIYSEKENDTSN